MSERLRHPFSIAAITGAGISAPSGIPLLDCDIDGIPLEAFFQPHLRDRSAKKYFDIYRKVLSSWRKARPNAAHYSLAQSNTWVITQNIDGLHRDAETKHLIELHGNLRELRCTSCSLIFASNLAFQVDVPVCPNCKSVLHPGITLEGEEVRHFNRAMDWVGRSQVVLVVGTHLNMTPVSQLANAALNQGADVYLVNDDADSLLPTLLERRIKDSSTVAP